MTRPVRVAHVIHDLRAGGTERRMLAVLAGLDRRRFDPLLVCIDGLGELAGDARALGLEPVVLGRSRRLDARGIVRLARLLRSERVQVVHGWLSFANLFARSAGTLARVPVRIAGLGGIVETTDRRRAARYALLERALAPVTEAYVANSEALAESVRRRGDPTRKLVVIPNGVAIPPELAATERAHLRSELGVAADEPLIGMVARLDPRFKDHETLLAAFAALVREGRDVRLVFVGDGPARERLEELAPSLGIENRVCFAGYRADAARVPAALDVSVLLTYSEGFSNVVLETMAAGSPLVVTDIPPNREAVADGVHALVVPVGDAEATTAALRRLLDDRHLAASLAGESKRRAMERYSLEAQAAATMELYERLLRGDAATL
jgi:glycosyltransferase involved in cell wall biosynthesis